MTRQLRDLHGVGRAMLKDFEVLNVRSVEQLAESDPDKLFRRLERAKGVRVDPCCLDVFHCAVAQARDPNLPRDQCNWWWWSRKRKQEHEDRKAAWMGRAK